MQESDSLTFRPNAGFLVDKLYAGLPTAIEHPVEVVHREADVMNARSALRYEARDRRGGIVSLKKLHQWLAGAQAHNVRTVGILEWYLGQSQDITEERKALGKGLHSDSDVRYARAARGCWGH